MKMSCKRSLIVCLCAALMVCGPVQAKRRDGAGGGSAGTPNPILSFAADRAEYQLGDQALLSWASVETNFCTASGDWDGKFGTEGFWSSPPLDGPKTFTLKCTAKGGGVTTNVAVAIAAPITQAEPLPDPDPVLAPEPAPEPVPEPEPAPEPVPEPEPVPQTAPPTIAFAAADSEVTAGATTTLSWTTTDADGCMASGGWSGAKSANGLEPVGPIAASTTFALTCSGSGGNAVQMVSVGAINDMSVSWVAPSENVDGSMLTDLAGYRIYYGVESRNYDNSIEIGDPGATTYTFPVRSGDYYVAMTAYDADRNESAFSNEVLRTAP